VTVRHACERAHPSRCILGCFVGGGLTVKLSASVMASTRAQSVRGSTGSQGPAERRRMTAPVASRRASVRAIPVPLPGVCLAGGDDPRRRFTPRVGDHE
jgi:hypothetical protein